MTVLRAGDRRRRRRHLLGAHPAAGQEPAGDGRARAGCRRRTQPIAVDDVIRYLVGVTGVPEARGRVFEIGGPDRMTYLEMLQVAAEVVHRAPGPDRAGPGADAAAVVVLAGAGDRRRRHHRPQPDRLDGHRGRRHRPQHPRARAGRAAGATTRRYAARSRRRDGRSRPNTSGSANSIVSDQVRWVRIGREDAAGGAALADRRPAPSRTAAKVSITLPVASVASV